MVGRQGWRLKGLAFPPHPSTTLGVCGWALRLACLQSSDITAATAGVHVAPVGKKSYLAREPDAVLTLSESATIPGPQKNVQ